MTKQKDETFLQFAKRATQALFNKEINYIDWEKAIIGEDLYSEETARRCSCFFKRFLEELDEADYEMIDDDNKIAELIKLRDEIKAERIKIQTANLEFNANERQVVRNALFQEQVLSAIERLEPVKVKDIKVTHKTGSSGLICIYDLHAGATYEIKGLYNEVVNSYSYEIMENRLWYLLGQMVESDIVYDDLTVVFGGDLIDNILRMSSLTKLKEPVVDTVIRLSEFLSNWIVEARNRLQVPINVVIIGGNHDENRILGQKPQFEGENYAKIICEFVKLRLTNVPDITVDNYTDVSIKTIRKTNILFDHGLSDPIATMDYFSNLYSIDIDEAYYGHLHRQESKSAGIADVGDRMVYRVGSIVGVDPYAKKLRKASRPSATFVSFTDDGHDWQKTYYLG